MSSLVYLISRKFKNRFKEIFHKPGELVVLLISIALVGFVIFAGNISDESYAVRSFEEFKAIVLAVYALVFVLTAKNGFVNGASMFSMADVNFLFTGPHKSKTLLSYGLFSQLGRSLMLGVFILYQYSWIHDSYGISIGSLIAVLVGYAVTVFLSQMLAMLIYSFTSSSDKKCNIAKTVFYGIIVAFLGHVGYKTLTGNGLTIDNAVSAANETIMHFFPFAGFVQLGVTGFISGNYIHLAIAVGCMIACIAIYYTIVSTLNTDYYEDVLKATEVSFTAITARKEGKAQENVPRNIKVGKTGINKGYGASVIAEKHKVENRRSRFFILDITSLIFAISTIAFGFIMKDPMMAFAFSAYMMIISVNTGRWAKELLLPYIYLIPEPPFKKLIYTLREQIPVFLAEAAITFIPFYFIFRCGIVETVGMIVGKVSFGWLFIGVSLILQRLFGNSNSKVLLVSLNFLFCAIASVPAIVSAVLVSMTVMPQLMYWAIAGANLIVGTIIIFLCRNVLECAQNNNR